MRMKLAFDKLKPIHKKKKLFKYGICDYRNSRKGDFQKHVVSDHEENK